MLFLNQFSLSWLISCSYHVILGSIFGLQSCNGVKVEQLELLVGDHIITNREATNCQKERGGNFWTCTLYFVLCVHNNVWFLSGTRVDF